MISSAQNTQVKNIIKLNQKAKARREQGLFIAEGRKMFLEAPDDWIEKIYVAESMLEDEEVMTKVRRFSWEAVENGVFSRDDHPDRRRCRSEWGFPDKNLCGYYKSKGNSCNDGICLQNSFFLCGRCGIIKTETSGKRNPLFCRTFTG